MSSETATQTATQAATQTGTQTPRGRERTRARLLAAAEEVFVRKGVRRVTVDDLVHEAGYTRGAFYSNFASIDEVFYAVFRARSEEMIATVRRAIDETPEGEFTLALLMERLHPIARRWFVIQTEFVLLALRDEEARAVHLEHHAQLKGELVSLITGVLDRLGRVPDVPVEQLSETAIALYLHALAQEGLGTDEFGMDSFVASVLPQVLVGFSHEA